MIQRRIFHTMVLVLFCLVFSQKINAQEHKIATASNELVNEIARMDSLLFDAFNRQDMNTFQSMFTDDLEWFQDNSGLLSHQTVFERFGGLFDQPNKLTRQLIKGSLEVHPIKDYGAIEIGTHKFIHTENGQLIEGTFKFLMIWKLCQGSWKISRVVSYDH